ncbi:MAG: U32 family peptidase [Odoribacteraceae bacterium]|jgi:putative protease|nr:U32 family peptidase [Odoribacteraceae bacterium]
MRRLELLAPARDEAAARAAILNGADAVYIGAPAFGARKAAGNSLETIERVVTLAHRYRARVFATLNTVLRDDELMEASRLARSLYNAGVDALVVQDMAFLQLDLPPVALHASTQMHNHDVERVKFLDRLGFQRVVLARELSLEQVRAIRREVSLELEYFVHGALCVSLSGQCYISSYLTGRSANRGECAQLCRARWSVADSAGKVIARDKYLLSLKDLNLSGSLPELVAAGIDSFKIEGRLKDASYVANVTRHYSSLLDDCIDHGEGLARASFGVVTSSFEADPARSFNRGFTGYFLHGRARGMVNEDTPKSTGKRVAKVLGGKGNCLTVEAIEPLHNADGLCFISGGELQGCHVNRVEGDRVYCNERVEAPPGTWLYRNRDHAFEALLARRESTREVRVEMDIHASDRRLLFSALDEDGTRAAVLSDERFEPAARPDLPGQVCRQAGKCGGTGFRGDRVTYHGDPLFVPLSVVNRYRRLLLQALEGERERAFARWTRRPSSPGALFPGPVDWRLNITNALAMQFYRDHGVASPPAGFEAGGDRGGKAVMRCRYCILFERGACLRRGGGRDLVLPLYLYNSLGRFRLEFDCAGCFMLVIAPGGAGRDEAVPK